MIGFNGRLGVQQTTGSATYTYFDGAQKVFLPGYEVTSHKNTPIGTTGRVHTKRPGLTNWEAVKCELDYSDTNYVLFNNLKGLVRTWKVNSPEDDVTGTTEIFSGFVKKSDPVEMGPDEWAMLKVEIEVVGDVVTYTGRV